jgi:hypothetical protein
VTEHACKAGQRHCYLDDRCYAEGQFHKTSNGVEHVTGGAQPRHTIDGRMIIGAAAPRPAIERPEGQ